MIVLDSSAVLADFNDEPGADQVRAAIRESVVSSVNFGEIYSKVAERRLPELLGILERQFRDLAVVPFDKEQAILVGNLRPLTRQIGLSFSDRACIALAKIRNLPVLTADRAWAGLKLGVDIRLIR